MAPKGNRIWTPAGSKAQEAFCRHQMIADIYCHAGRTERHVEVLSHDIDVDGVDLTLVHDGTVAPLQLKSRIHGSKTRRWSVRRRIVFPLTHTLAHRGLFANLQDVSNEGLGGALVVQDTFELPDEPFIRVWYRVGRLDLIRLRSEKRFDALIKASGSCPPSLVLLQSDLTPPITIGELLWLLVDIDALSPLLKDRIFPWRAVGNMLEVPTTFELGQHQFVEFEKAARARFKAWPHTVGAQRQPSGE